VALSRGLVRGLTRGLRVGLNGSSGFLATGAAVNSLLSPFGATASAGWNLDELSGNSSDLFGVVPLTPSLSPTQGVLTGLPGGDRGIQLADASQSSMAAGSSAVLEPALGDLFMAFTFRLLANPAATRMMIGKRQATSRGYYIQVTTAGRIDFVLLGAGGIVQCNGASGHAGEEYHDGLAVLTRAGGAALITDLGDSGVFSVATLGDLTSTTAFRAGTDPSVVLSPSCIITSVVWGTATGTLLANRAAALAAWRGARGA
jgi:hypothetical protein